MNKKFLFFIKLSFSFLILIILIYKIGINDILRLLLNIDLMIIPIFLFFYFLNLFIGALNIKVLLSPYKVKIPLLRLYKYYIATFSIGLFLLGRIGDLSLVYFLKKEKLDLGRGSSIFILDKLITLSIIVILSIIGFFLFFSGLESLKMIITLLVVMMVILFILFSNKTKKLIIKHILKDHAKKFMGYSISLKNYLKYNKLELVTNYLLTALKMISEGLTYYVLFWFFGINAPFLSLIIIRATLLGISLIPISISGTGIKESAGVFLFSKLSIEPDISLSVLLIVLVLNYLFSGLFLLSTMKKEDLDYKKILEL